MHSITLSTTTKTNKHLRKFTQHRIEYDGESTRNILIVHMLGFAEHDFIRAWKLTVEMRLRMFLFFLSDYFDKVALKDICEINVHQYKLQKKRAKNTFENIMNPSKIEYQHQRACTMPQSHHIRKDDFVLSNIKI